MSIASQSVKLLSAFTFVLMMATSSAHATVDGCAIVLKTPDGFLNLRKEPSAKSGVVVRLKPGDRLEITIAGKPPDGWTQVDSVVRLDGGNYLKPHRGWVTSRYLRVVPDCWED